MNAYEVDDGALMPLADGGVGMALELTFEEVAVLQAAAAVTGLNVVTWARWQLIAAAEAEAKVKGAAGRGEGIEEALAKLYVARREIAGAQMMMEVNDA